MANTRLYPATVRLGVGKKASAYWLEAAAAVHGADGRGRSYVEDERTLEGESIMTAVDGPALWHRVGI